MSINKYANNMKCIERSREIYSECVCKMAPNSNSNTASSTLENVFELCMKAVRTVCVKWNESKTKQEKYRIYYYVLTKAIYQQQRFICE